MAPEVVALIGIAGFASLLVVAAFSDLATMTIPNWVSIVAVAAFPIVAWIAGLPAGAIGMHALTGALVFFAGFLLFCAGVLGGGDVKVLAAAAVWTGAAAFGPFAMWTALAGGALALAILAARRFAAPSSAFPAFLNRLLARENGIPYGVAIAFGGIVTAPLQPLAHVFN